MKGAGCGGLKGEGLESYGEIGEMEWSRYMPYLEEYEGGAGVRSVVLGILRSR